MQLASRFGHVNQIRRDRPLTREELMQVVPSVFGEDKHTSRSENYTWIPTITVLESLQREGFQPFFACQTRVRDPGRRGYTKHMLRLRRDGEINGQHVPEIILLNSHDGTSSYQMLPGYFRFVCQNGCVCGQSLGEVRVPHRGNVVEKVIEGAYEVVAVCPFTVRVPLGLSLADFLGSMFTRTITLFEERCILSGSTLPADLPAGINIYTL